MRTAYPNIEGLLPKQGDLGLLTCHPPVGPVSPQRPPSLSPLNRSLSFGNCLQRVAELSYDS